MRQADHGPQLLAVSGQLSVLACSLSMDLAPDSSPGFDQPLIPIRTFLSESEADIAQGALRAFGIHSLLSHDNCGGQRPHLNLAGGIRLLVHPDDVAQAEEALTANPESEES